VGVLHGLCYERSMTSDEDLLRRITVDPAKFGGKPIVRDERMTVEQLLRWLAGGTTEAELLKEFPFLEADDIRAALLYAGRLTAMSRWSGSAVAAADALDDTTAR